MKKSTLTVLRSTSLVLTLILLYGCAGKTQPPVSMLTTETHTKVWKRVVNPETGISEMRLVSEEHTKTQTPAQNSGHSAQKPEWAVYAVCNLIIGVSCLIIALD